MAKTLAEYLAEYIDHAVGGDNVLPDDLSILLRWIEQGIEAYELVNNVNIIRESRDRDPKDKTYACESCSLVKSDVVWRDETEQYECDECYQVWCEEQGIEEAKDE